MVPRLRSKKGGDARVARGSPWIFRDEAANAEELRALGHPALLANVENSEGREMGSAVVNLQKGGPTGCVNIFARMVSDNVNDSIDRSFFVKHIRRALQHREHIFGSHTYYRLLNAEGDHLPGVACDRYGDVLCVQFTSAAMELLFEKEVLDALELVLAPRAIIMRYDAHTDRQLELAPIRQPFVARGEYTGPTVLPEEDGFAFEVDLLAADCPSGHFFAERPQRALLSRALADAGAVAGGAGAAPRALSLFGRSSGVFCAARGARATCVEGPGEASRAHVEAMAQRNGCREVVECLHLELPQAQLLGEGRLRSYDVVALEPHALAPTYGRLEEGLQGYAAWVAVAAAATRPGGFLLVACRSRTVTGVRLLRSVNLGIWSAKRRARLVHRSAAPPGDFPVHLALPNSCDLQVLGLRVQ